MGSVPFQSPNNTHPEELNFYISIIEKAYAERVKGIENIEKRAIEETLFDLTGAPSEIIKHCEIELMKSRNKINIPYLDYAQIEKEWHESEFEEKGKIILHFLKHCFDHDYIVMAKASKESEDFRSGFW